MIVCNLHLKTATSYYSYTSTFQGQFYLSGDFLEACNIDVLPVIIPNISYDKKTATFNAANVFLY